MQFRPAQMNTYFSLPAYVKNSAEFVFVHAFIILKIFGSIQKRISVHLVQSELHFFFFYKILLQNNKN